MDNEHSSGSPSAAAVADGVSAAAKNSNESGYNGKDVTDSNAGISMSPNTSSTNVRLLIKASSQQFEDMTVESDLRWTVKRLKLHLSHVYPSRPAIDDQKLIYSGQLLKDNHQLKDIIRNYKDVYTQNHVIHLVCSISANVPLPGTSAAASRQHEPNKLGHCNDVPITDRLQQRHFGNSVSSEHPPMPPGTFLSGDNNGNLQTPYQQQMAMYNWLQQVYNQYMEQYFQRLSSVEGIEMNTVDNSATLATTSNIPPLQQQQQEQQQQQPVMVERAAEPAARILPRAANVAHPAPMAAAGQFPTFEPDDMNSDWLDTVFCLIRLMLFFTIFYFNFSPLRCFVAIAIAVSIYSYHTRYRRAQRMEQNNNNINRNNNEINAADRGTAAAATGVTRNAAVNTTANENGDTTMPSNTAEANAGDDSSNNRLAFALAFVRTFVVSFFTSLLPEATAL